MSVADAASGGEERPARLARAHAIAGWLTFAAFLVTGQFMRFGYPGVEQPDLAHRVFFRTHHLYLLGAALVQLVVAAHLRATSSLPARRPRLRVIASTLLLLGPPLLLLGFATEHASDALRGEATALGWQASLVGVLLHLLAERR